MGTPIILPDGIEPGDGAYWAGYNSYNHSIEVCPYEHGTNAWDNWWAGWETAVSEDAELSVAEDGDA